MSCPKTNPNYPSTAMLVQRPYGALVRQIDEDFDKAHRFDLAYEFRGRRFVTDAMLSGAYFAIADQTPAGVAAAFKAANGFCDLIDDGTVFTGTGAGGANPGAVPSVGPGAGVSFFGGLPTNGRYLTTPDGLFITTQDGSLIEVY